MVRMCSVFEEIASLFSKVVINFFFKLFCFYTAFGSQVLVTFMNLLLVLLPTFCFFKKEILRIHIFFIFL